VITFDTTSGTVCWTFNVNGVANLLAPAIQTGVSGKTGPVIVPLGSKFLPKGCVVVPMKSVKAVLTSPGSYYVNVPTRKYLSGAVRGQLRKGG
jgi:hypothetical protein